MGTIPIPPTIAANQFVTSTVMNQYRDATNFQARTPRAYVYRNAALSMPNYTTNFTIISFDAEVNDYPVLSGDAPLHDLATNPERLFFRTAGNYSIAASIDYTGNATGIRSIMIRKNSAGSDSGGTYIVGNTVGNAGTGITTSVPVPTVELPFAAGDYLEVYGRQNSGGSLAVGVGGSGFTFLRVWLSSW